jgi:Ca2+-binding RTX toxin-like protein
MATFTGTSKSDLIKGTSLPDIINGNAGNDWLYGFGGNDTINGGSGHDFLSGGDGNDILIGGSGTNDLVGGAGADRFVMSARSTTSWYSDDLVYDMTDGDLLDVSAWGISDFSQVRAVLEFGVYGAEINAYYYGEDHFLSLAGIAPRQLEAADFVYWNGGGATQNGTAYGDMLFGSRGDDVLNGGGGYDTLLGGLGNDRIDGGANGDDIFGGAGRDVLTGGTGADAFYYQAETDSAFGAAHDVITDFQVGWDWIDLFDVDANTALAGNQGFHWIGTANFTGAGQLRYVQSGGVTMIFGNTDADATAEFQIELTGAVTLHHWDFVL